MRDDLFDKEGNLIGSYESEYNNGGIIIMKKTYDNNGRLIEFWRQEGRIGSERKTTYKYDDKGKVIKVKEYKSTDESLKLIFKWLRYFSFTIFLISPAIILSIIKAHSLGFTLMMILSNSVFTVIFTVILIAVTEVTYAILYLGSINSLSTNDKKYFSAEYIFKYITVITLINIYSVVQNSELFFF